MEKRKKKINWLDITRADVIKAIEIFFAENPEYPFPKNTFLIYKGNKLPAKHIRGMAYKVAYGNKISKSDFGGGMETVRFFERLGFEMDYHGISKDTTLTKSKKKSVLHKEIIVEQKIKPAVVDDGKQTVQHKKKKTEENKVVIPSKKVIEQKNALFLLV